MKNIDSGLLKRFIQLAGDSLEGDWIIIGGTVLPLVGIDFRTTVDIDLAGPASATQSDTLKLMKIAEKLGLPVESINQAGAFFLRKIPRWEKMLVLIHTGKKAKIYRPNITLFLKLKISRLSETDLQDCLEFLKLSALGEIENPDTALLRKDIAQEIKKASKEKIDRLESLKTALTPPL